MSAAPELLEAVKAVKRAGLRGTVDLVELARAERAIERALRKVETGIPEPFHVEPSKLDGSPW
jgi:hypothetical protein